MPILNRGYSTTAETQTFMNKTRHGKMNLTPEDKVRSGVPGELYNLHDDMVGATKNILLINY